MDVGKLLQENAGIVGIVGTVVGFVASQLVQIWRDHKPEQSAINGELRVDKRAQRDAKLARMRTAFKPVILAAWTLQTAGSEFLMSLWTSTRAPPRNAMQVREFTGTNKGKRVAFKDSL